MAGVSDVLQGQISTEHRLHLTVVALSSASVVREISKKGGLRQLRRTFDRSEAWEIKLR